MKNGLTIINTIMSHCKVLKDLFSIRYQDCEKTENGVGRYTSDEAVNFEGGEKILYYVTALIEEL